ncbi:MAG: GNAT family N-acetyltransferase [Phycisphaeraceae bacterium]|nr:GNAT family N-acetyltransferase [Phycisphaeraceae bacterium]
MIEIRPYLDSDREPLRAIFNHIVDRGDAFVYDAPLSASDFAGYLAAFTAAYVAVHDGRVVGGYVLRPNQPGRGSHTANAAYMVAPDSRGLGLGRRLGEHSLAEARRLGFAAMQFNAVVGTNTHAVALWQGLGFTIIGTLPRAFRHADGRLVDLHVMHRDL